MINQGEKIDFKGLIQIKNSSDEWVYVNYADFPYKIKVRISNVDNLTSNKVVLNFDSDSIVEATKVTISQKSADPSVENYLAAVYSFSIGKIDSAKMCGECTCEIALVDSLNNNIISDEKIIFTVNQSPLGRQLSTL